MTFPITCSCLGAVGCLKLDSDELLHMFVEQYPHLIKVALNRGDFDLGGPEWATLRAAYIDISNRYAFKKRGGDQSPEAYQDFLESLKALRNNRGRCGSCGMWLFRMLETYPPALRIIEQSAEEPPTQAYA